MPDNEPIGAVRIPLFFFSELKDCAGANTTMGIIEAWSCCAIRSVAIWTSIHTSSLPKLCTTMDALRLYAYVAKLLCCRWPYWKPCLCRMVVAASCLCLGSAVYGDGASAVGQYYSYQNCARSTTITSSDAASESFCSLILWHFNRRSEGGVCGCCFAQCHQ